MNSSSPKHTFKILDILNSKTGTLLVSAMAIAIGFAFKDLINSAVTNILQPLVVIIITITRLNKYYDFSHIISTSNNSVNISSFVSSLVSFIFTIISVYFLHDLISVPLSK